jgi:glucose-6-phosphate 1-dehydrogenase
MRGDACLFAREDAIEAHWRIVDPVLDLDAEPYPYESGSWGSSEADRLVARVPGGWHKPVVPDGEAAQSEGSVLLHQGAHALVGE